MYGRPCLMLLKDQAISEALIHPDPDVTPSFKIAIHGGRAQSMRFVGFMGAYAPFIHNVNTVASPKVKVTISIVMP